MLINSVMEGETNKLISSLIGLRTEDKERSTIKTLLKNFILPNSDNMAIKQNQSNNNEVVYTVPITAQSNADSRTRYTSKSIKEAKEALLDAMSVAKREQIKTDEPTLHYAQIAITTNVSDDTRSTGGGKMEKKCPDNSKSNSFIDTSHNLRKCLETQQRKVSFKVKNVSLAYKKPLPKTVTTVAKTKVSELAKIFNDLDKQPVNGLPISIKNENKQSLSRRSSLNSTPSSTLSSSPNVKIVFRQRRGSKKRSNRKRCSSMDSIDKFLSSESASAGAYINRSKSDGTKIPKSPRRRSKPPNIKVLTNKITEVDTIDGNIKKLDINPTVEIKKPEKNVVKNVIRKFENEIIAQNNLNSTLKRQCESSTSHLPVKDKPKVPEKKSSLVVTKNIVMKDGIAKIKTIKKSQIESSTPLQDNMPKQSIVDPVKKSQPLHGVKKSYKTNYIHSEKLPLHAVEIIQEDVSENVTKISAPLAQESDTDMISVKNDNSPASQPIDSNLAPNESFLWRRKSYTQIYSDSEKLSSENTYSPYSLTTLNEVTITDDLQKVMINSESQVSEQTDESQETNTTTSSNCDTNADFESDLVEAYNKEVLVGFTSKPKKELVENDYEVLEPKLIENVVVIPVNTVSRNSKINCPLPEIPKQEETSTPNSPETENIYQCLLEMRSHPEGDESSIHSYELYDSKEEERTRGDGDSDDGYEYCKSPIKPYCLASGTGGIQIAEGYKPYAETNGKHYPITKSVSGTSTISYEKIGTDRIYEKIPPRPLKAKNCSPSYSNRHSIVSDSTGYNDHENIYDTIKHSDNASVSNCYESIPNSPNVVKLRNNPKKHLPSTVQKRLSFDNVSNISQLTMSSEQKTNSIYGQRSVLSYNGQEIAFQVPSSETSASDRSDDWVDVSDEEKNDEQRIIIVRERSRGRKSPISWSQKVRHQWQKSPKHKHDDKECDSSDSGHVYESLEPATPTEGPVRPAPPRPLPLEDDFDSFDSDTDCEEIDKSPDTEPPTIPSRLPAPPSGAYTLTKIASAAQRKMRQIKRNLTKRYSVAMDGKPFTKSPPVQKNDVYEQDKRKSRSPIYANCDKAETQNVYSNVNFNDTKPVTKTENPKIYSSLKDELKTVIGDKRLSNGDVPPPLPEKVEKPTTPTSEKEKKDMKENGMLSRKAYFSFKSRFRRATSMAVDINDVPSALKITNSTFYLTDSMDVDSGFSNCSDNGQPGSTETLSPGGNSRRRDGMKRVPWAESSPCLALERPSVPPPPPPTAALPAPTDLSAVNEELKRLLPTLSRKDKAPRARTSWYAECGADSTSNTSWYADAGLYQAGNISSSSGASSGSHPASPLPHSLFTHEPLYQFYNAAKVESIYRETGDSDSDAYEGGSVGSGSSPAAPARPSAMALVAPRGPARTLWCEVPEVVNSTVLSSLAPAQKRLQEAKFELLTSEASYLNSLNVLETHFISHPAFRDPHVLPREDWEILFSTILPVRRCSQLLMNELEKCWQENILLSGICEIVGRVAEQQFQVYVKYCENQALMVRALQRLRERTAFAQALKRLESHPACQCLSLHSFLMLPMQRVTRLPLLLDAVYKNLAPGDHEYEACSHALATLNSFVSECNEGARNTERIEEMFRLSQCIEFPPNIRNPPSLGPACGRRDRRPVRWLVRSGEMTHLVWKTDELKLTFGKKFHKIPLYLFLFNDIFVITKKKSESSYVAVDHCARSLLEVCASDTAPAAAKHALLVTLLENHEGRTLEMLMSCASETDASRWSEALAPVGGGSGVEAEEAVYAGWDCPQVAALYAYSPAQPDELPLNEGDVVNVTRKTSEGWYYGERTRDGEAGWFPGAYTVEIASAHVRARNLRQRYRLLALSGTYRGGRKRHL